MRREIFSDHRFKIMMTLLIVIVGSLDLWASFHWERGGKAGIAGTFAVELGKADENYRLPIKKLQSGSPLSIAGASVGDAIKFDHIGDHGRALDTREWIGLTIYKQASPLYGEHFLLQPKENPEVTNNPMIASATTFLQLLTTYLVIVIVSLLSWRQASNVPLRFLALAMLTMVMDTVLDLIPGGGLQDFLTTYVNPIQLFVGYVFFSYFCLIYPAEQAHWRKAWVRVGFCLYLFMYAAYALYHLLNALEYLPWLI